MASKANNLMLFEKNRSRYDEKSAASILEYARRLCGLTFEDILWQNGLTEEEIGYLAEMSMTNKGLLGNLIEQAWFGYRSNPKQEADFSEVGIELKSTPYEEKRSGIRPGETLSLTQINYRLPQESDFYRSHVWEKMQKILIVYYLREKNIAEATGSKLFYRIKYVFMLRPDKKDIAVIEADYRLLNGYMVRGEAHKLSRSHGQYLGVAPKSGKKEFVPQFYGDHIKALKRGYVLKIAYLTYILKRAAGIIEDEGGTVITDVTELQEKTLADILVGKVDRFVGMRIIDIWKQVGGPGERMPSGKNEDAVLACRMLGVKRNRVEEFMKAGIIPKTIKYRINKNDNQHFRLEDVNFLELDAEERDDDIVAVDNDDDRHGWEASRLYSILADRQYFLMVFWETPAGKVFKGCQLWSMPDKDLEVVHEAWIKIKDILRDGVEFYLRHDRYGKLSIGNNLPGAADNGVFHLRPHANQSYHEIDGVIYGNGKISDSVELPNGDRIARQSYWLNKGYMESQLRPDLVMKYDGVTNVKRRRPC